LLITLFQLFFVRRAGLYSQATGDKKVTGIPVSYFYQFVLTAQVIYVLN
jgi:hypothetical protein